jgi:gluconate 5-dehydrogenase
LRSWCRVVINSRTPNKLEKAKQDLEKSGVAVYTLVFDVTNENSVNEGISEIEKNVGPVDPGHNAAIIKRSRYLICRLPISRR